MSDFSVVIIGAGISGLAAAVTLKRGGIDPLVIEALPQPGGSARTLLRDGYLCEAGPNTLMLSNPEVAGFLQETGLLAAALDAAPHAKKRFVAQGGRLVALPSSPVSFALSGALSWRAKLRMLCEPFIPKGVREDETLAEFVRRRLGEEPLHELVGPFVSGVYAGDPERLVVRHALPKLHRLEQAHGSLIRGAIRLRQGAAPKGRLLSWPGGLAEMAAALAGLLGNRIRFSSPVERLRREADGWVIDCNGAKVRTQRVVLATDVATAVRLLEPVFHDVGPLRNIPVAPMAVIHLGFERLAVKHPLDGFGVLISRRRGLRTLGALFSSTLFPGRAPADRVLLTAFMGGMLDREVLALDDRAIIETVLRDLTPLLGIRAPAVFRNLTRWPRAIPQYERDHPRVLEACGRAEAACPGLELIGNYRGGISLEACLANGRALGLRLAAEIARRT